MSEALKERPNQSEMGKPATINNDGEETVIPFFDSKDKAKFNKQLSIFHQQVKQPAKNGHVDFTSKKGRTKYDYVLLQDLIKAIDDGLKGTGMTWTQEVRMETQTIGIQTIIKSDNGYQEKYGWMTLPNSRQPQDIGSALTYLKRYSLGTAFGVNSETDDDAALANENANKQKNTSNQQQSNPVPDDNAISSKQVGTIKVIASRISKMWANTQEPKTEAEIIHGYLDKAHVKEITDLDKHIGSLLIKKIASDEKELKDKLAATNQQESATTSSNDPFEDLEE